MLQRVSQAKTFPRLVGGSWLRASWGQEAPQGVWWWLSSLALSSRCGYLARDEGILREITLTVPTAAFQVHPEGKFVVDVDKNIDINDVSVLEM